MKILPVLFSAILFAGCVSTSSTVERSIDPKKAADTRLELGMKYLDAGNRDQALRQFLDVLEHDKKNARALQGLAMVHELNGESEDAEKNFLLAIKFGGKTNISPIRYTYGIFLVKQSRYADAQAQFEDVAKDLGFPDRAASLYFAGRCALEQGNVERAKAAFSHSINLKSTLPSPVIELADLAFQEQDYSSAKRYLDRYHKLTKPTARSLWLGIRIERIFGNKDKMASQALALKNLFGYSKEYLEYKQLIENQ